MSEFLQIVVPVVSVFISYWLGRVQQEQKFRREQALERYKSFYVPFFTKLYAGRLWEFSASGFGLEVRSAFLDLLTANMASLGPKVQSCYPDLYVAFCEMLDYEASKPGYSRAPKHFDEAFMRTVKAAITESRELCRALHLPPISATYESYLCKAHRRRPRRAQERSK